MPAALPLPLRQQIVQRHQQGEPLAAIAHSMQLRYPTACLWWRRFQQAGEAGLATHYDRCGPQGPKTAPAIHQAALTDKREHPTWGAGLIRLQLLKQFPGQSVPQVRGIQRWFHAAELQPPRAKRLPQQRERAKEPHEVWEIDAKERMQLADGSGTSVLTVTDEATGALLQVAPFPQYHWTQVATTAVQQQLQAQFGQWGMPRRIRVDNGAPWGSWSDLPPPLLLWWVGLGIAPIWNRPHSPTENAKVERQNGTVNRWGEPKRCADYAAWEQKVAWVAHVQREEYPAVAGQSRLAAHPALQIQARPYQVEHEREQWQLERVTAFLAVGQWPRQVSHHGQISLYGQAYQVGSRHGGKQVWVRLDATTREWVVQGKEGELVRHAAEQLTAERICALQAAKPHASSPKGERCNLPPQ